MMFKEMRGLEYTLEVLRVFYNSPGKHDSKVIYELINCNGSITVPSLTYVQKILPRMAKIGLLSSSESGYSLVRPIEEITVGNILSICNMPSEKSSLYLFCDKLKKVALTLSVEEFYKF